VSERTLALISIPLLTGAIGYATNWTGVVMLFHPVHFRGVRSRWLLAAAQLLPRRLQQIPGMMVGGIGWQGIVPSRAAKMGSLAVDVGIAKLGSAGDFFRQLEPDRIARHIVERTRGEIPTIVDRVMAREMPRLWGELPMAVRGLVHGRVQQQLPAVVSALTEQIALHIDQLVDVKLMVIRRFDPELANRVFLDIGARELRFIRNFGFAFGFLLGLPLALLTRVLAAWWLLPLLGVLVGYLTNWLALWMIYEPAVPVRVGPLRLQGLFIRRQPEVAEVYARIVSEEIVTVASFGDELLHGPQSDRTRALIEEALRPAIDRAVGRAAPAIRLALGTREYEAIRHAFAAEPVESLILPLADPDFSRAQAGAMRKLITERMRAMSPTDFGDMLRAATREDEWLLLLHGAVLGFAGGLIHLGVFG
jgi:uncharacterized membrane protein YheB (UPF0754 family)